MTSTDSGRLVPQSFVGHVPGRRILIQGVTQGVGFRPWVYRLSKHLGVTGLVRNTSSGVLVEAFASQASLHRLLELLARPDLPAASVERVDWRSIDAPAPPDFSIAASDTAGRQQVALSPDLALCPACKTEISDPADRRYRYAFTNCTNCGPRFTIARALPYDRARTTMAAFTMCPACSAEYESPGDRRHHAEANACPRCGPQLELWHVDGRVLAKGSEAVDRAARQLGRGAIIALRGLGGYHLVCDATDEDAVARLRERKRRPAKPFAVMARDLAQAHALARIDGLEDSLLNAPEAPIVLVRRRGNAVLARGVAPGLPWLGLMLPHTPLHHLLLDASGRPLVMTSGNRHGEPIAYREDDARARLSPLVDAFLDHDREIIAPCDDSVVRVIGGDPTVLRRSRGYAPLPLTLPAAVPEPVLACGAQLANTFCLARDDRAWPSQHVGDLDSPEAADELARAVERMERWLGTRADVVAHDLHPGYASTRFALERDARLHVPVQHHHAHVASAMAEHHLEGPVLGVVFDGTGLGTDGALWGGEVLLASAVDFERLATLRPILLAGGEAAIRDVWRLGLAVLEDAFDGAPPLEALPLFRDLVPAEVAAVRGLLQQRFRCAPAHGAGRWFDALGALVLDRPRAHHQGDVATLWNAVADETECRPYPFELGEPSSLAETARAVPEGHNSHAPQLEIDLRPMVRAAVEDRLRQRPPAEIAGRFHATLASALAATLAALRTGTGNVPVVLSGGCFQNALLAERVTAALEPGWRVVRHRRVPPGDGGLALGQALVAGAVLRAGGGESPVEGEKPCVSVFQDE